MLDDKTGGVSFAELMWVALAMLGGIARYLDSYLRTGAAIHYGKLVAHSLVSGFSGYMTAQVVIQFSVDWAIVAAGVGGYLGTQALDWIATILVEKFGGDKAAVDTKRRNSVDE
jgi:hypothetical protein